MIGGAIDAGFGEAESRRTVGCTPRKGPYHAPDGASSAAAHVPPEPWPFKA